MSLSPIIRKPVFWLSLGLALPTLALGQAAYVTNLAEYAVAGKMPGDQVRPQAALTTAGGWLVWDDNAIDGHGQGVAALALDSNFQGVGSPFRVNQNVGGDQTHAQVALLNGGGAVIVWQGGVKSRENVYARFLSSSNTWLTGDVLVNASAGEFHQNPAVAVLTNGNVVVVWGSYNEFTSSSLQDVYGQVLSPAGQKVGAEFLINQFTLYNQRTPSIAALNSGGFVVAWVSEQENNLAITSTNRLTVAALGAMRPSVDIYARIFGPDASALSNELLINTNSNPCATPVIAAAPDNGFLVIWGEKDMAVSANGWDVLARRVSSIGLEGVVRKVNTYTYGDQFAPRLAVNGANVFVVWTSLGQDGSWEGVYGQLLQFDGTPVGAELRLNTTTVGRQIQPAVAGDGAARFVGLWSSFSALATGMDLYGQQYAQAGFVPGPTVTNVFAAPAADPFPILLPADGSPAPLVAASTGMVEAGAQSLSSPVPALAAQTNAAASLLAAEGSYSGLVWDTNQVVVSDSAFITVKTSGRLTSQGTLPYSGKLLLAGQSYAFSGQFTNNTGVATSYVKGSSGDQLTLNLRVNLLGGDQLQGSVVDVANGRTNWTSQLLADRAVASPVTVGLAGQSFTLAVPPVASTNGPVGFGYGTINVSSAGLVQWAGTLADGTKVSQSTGLSKQGLWPLFASLYGGGGVAVSWMQFTQATNGGDVSGQFIWIKNGNLAPKYAASYPQGITNAIFVDGSSYSAPAAGAPILNLTSGLASFYGGGVPSFANGFKLVAGNQVGSTNKLFKLKFTTSSGLFSGTAPNPANPAKPLSFQGVVYQKGTNGAGLFTGPTANGQVFICPAN